MEGGDYNAFSPAAYCCIPFQPPLVHGSALKACDVSEVFHMVVATNKYV